MFKLPQRTHHHREKAPLLNSCRSHVGKYIILLMTPLLSQLPIIAFSQSAPANTTITYNAKRVSLKLVFNEIKKQTNFDVLYNPVQIDTAALVSVNAKAQPLDEFLKIILAKQSLGYAYVNSTIVIFPKQNIPGYTPDAIAQGREIKGAVFEEKSGLPLLGVSIMQHRAGKGTQTNNNGEFLLKNVHENDSITFSIIGYESITMQVKNIGPTLFLAMKISTNLLDETIVQAYGVTSRRLSTGNIAKVSGEEIRRQPVLNPLLALQGRVAGMEVTPTSGFANAPVKVEIRGRNTLNKNFSSEPLYVVDGIPRVVLDVTNWMNGYGGPSTGPIQGGISMTKGQSILFGMNPDDIESIEILKDGDATALYGARGANGVVLITTKKPKTGRTALSITFDQSLSIIPKNIKMMNTREYLEMRREAFRNDGAVPTPENAPDLLLWDTNRSVNWADEILKTGSITRIGANVSGNDYRNSFYLSGQYVTTKSITQRSGKNEVIGFRGRMSHATVDKKFTVEMGANYEYTYSDAVSYGASYSMPPNAPAIWNEKGELNYAAWNEGVANPLSDRFPFAGLLRPSVSKTNMFSGNLNIKYNMFKGVEFNLITSYSNSQNTNDYFDPIASKNPALRGRMGNVVLGSTRSASWGFNPQLDYSTFINRGRLSLMVGARYDNYTTTVMQTVAAGFDNDDLLGDVSYSLFQQTSSIYGQNKRASLLARINYNWENKYILAINGNRDGSSRFAPDRLYGNFGSLSLAWIASEESWMKKMLPSWFSFLKFTGNYGITGSDGVGDYQYLSQWTGIDANTNTPMLDYNGTKAFIPMHPVNQQFHWETSKKLNIGTNLGFLDRINLDIDWYRNITDDALIDIQTPYYTGFGSVKGNSRAKIRNSGINIGLNATIIRNKNFSWSVQGNFSFNKNKLLSYPGLEYSSDASRYRIGESVTSNFYLHYLGVDPLTGRYSFEDYNKDGVITADLGTLPGSGTDDRYVALTMDPQYFGGFSTFLQYRSFQLSLDFSYKKGLQYDPLATAVPGSMNNLYMPAALHNNHWRKPGDNVKYPRYSMLSSGLLNYSDGQFTDGSYVRLNNIFLGWNLPQKMVKMAGMQSCQLSIAVSNVFVISNYKGIDPDITNMGTPPAPRNIDAKIILNF